MVRDTRAATAFRKLSITLAIGACFGGPAMAAPGDPLGPAFTLETGPYAFKRSMTARAGAGGFALAYEEILSGKSGIFVRLFDAAGNLLGDTVQVTDAGSSAPYAPAIAMAPGGGFVVAWHDNNNVYARRFSAAGVPAGGALQVSATTSAQVGVPSVAMDPNGDFVVAWSDSLVQNSSYINIGICGPYGICLPIGFRRVRTGIYARHYDASDHPAAQAAIASGETVTEAEGLVGSGTLSEVLTPTVAMDADGDYAMAWLTVNEVGVGFEPSGGEAGAVTAVRLQRFNAQGTPLERPLKVDSQIRRVGATRLKDEVANPVLAASASAYELMWLYRDSALRLRQFASRSTSSGSVATVPQDSSCIVVQPDLASNAAGEVVVSWDCDLFGTRIDAYRYAADGSGLGPVINVFTSPDANALRTSQVTVANDAAGNFVLAWTQDALGTDGNYTGTLVGRLYTGP